MLLHSCKNVTATHRENDFQLCNVSVRRLIDRSTILYFVTLRYSHSGEFRAIGIIGLVRSIKLSTKAFFCRRGHLWFVPRIEGASRQAFFPDTGPLPQGKDLTHSSSPGCLCFFTLHYSGWTSLLSPLFTSRAPFSFAFGFIRTCRFARRYPHLAF